ncbi:CRISPR-associated protein Csx19 [Streptomyces sp. NPDC001380]|uniref:type III-D CRISPR-associated protein Csx19 n=1 Tax=Streptomyces sp. NPDC001380 TaxID=3364566 RepID=UPI0036B4130D
MTTLHGRSHPDTTLADALAAAGFTGAVALLSSPHEHVAARAEGGRCSTPAADPYPLDAVFEARVFDEDRELRWLCTHGIRGRAVLLAEDEALLPGSFPERVPPLAAVGTLDAHYLLWGRPRLGGDGWTALHTPQIGTLHVPCPAPGPDRRLRLAAREYVCVEPRHGNAHVAEERLLRIEPTPAVRTPAAQAPDSRTSDSPAPTVPTPTAPTGSTHG